MKKLVLALIVMTLSMATFAAAPMEAVFEMNDVLYIEAAVEGDDLELRYSPSYVFNPEQIPDVPTTYTVKVRAFGIRDGQELGELMDVQLTTTLSSDFEQTTDEVHYEGDLVNCYDCSYYDRPTNDIQCSPDDSKGCMYSCFPQPGPGTDYYCFSVGVCSIASCTGIHCPYPNCSCACWDGGMASGNVGGAGRLQDVFFPAPDWDRDILRTEVIVVNPSGGEELIGTHDIEMSLLAP